MCLRGLVRAGRVADDGAVPSTDIALNLTLFDPDQEPVISVVLSSFNGERTLSATLAGLVSQQGDHSFEVIVVDDGSTDGTSAIAESFGCKVVTLTPNKGRGIALNRGFSQARAPVVAMIDDDCIPPHDWIERLAQEWSTASPSVTVLGGTVIAAETNTFNRRFVDARRPLAAQEADLDETARFAHRLRRVVAPPRPPEGRRAVFFTVGANMSIRRSAFEEVGGFEPTLAFAAEEENICRKLRARFGPDTVQLVPDIVMGHDFRPDLGDTMRRARAYGRASGALFMARRGIPSVPPRPLLIFLIMALAAVRRPRAGLSAGIVTTMVLYREWIIRAQRHHALEPLTYPVINLAEETSSIIGFADGVRRSIMRRRTGNSPKAI